MNPSIKHGPACGANEPYRNRAGSGSGSGRESISLFHKNVNNMLVRNAFAVIQFEHVNNFPFPIRTR